MQNSRSIVDWLLQSPTASLRYLAKTQLLGLSQDEPSVIADYQAIQNSPPVESILSKQIEPGRWQHPRHYYSPKYRSTHWTLMVLEELCADPESEAFQKGVEFILCQTEPLVEKYSKTCDSGFTCLFGNILHYAIYAGFLPDNRTQKLIELLNFSLLNSNCSCRYNAGLPCSWGAARSLWGLAALPIHQRQNDTKLAIQKGLTFLTEEFDLLKANYPYPQGGRVHPVWDTVNYPLFYQADILFVLRVCNDLGQIDLPGIQPAREWLRARQHQNGHWTGSNPFGSKTWSFSKDKDDHSRWLTLHALTVLGNPISQVAT